MDATDKKLIEQAAQAIGNPVEAWMVDARSVPVAILHNGERWQPLLQNRLTDCMGDALRLAVKLDMDIIAFGRPDVTASTGTTDYLAAVEAKAKDPCAAIRRAIVRAAAEIWRQK